MDIGSAPASVRLSLLRASDGDCLFLSCRQQGRCYNILVDAGRARTAALLASFVKGLPESDRHIDLFVVTHIDADHIAGALAFARDDTLKGMVRSIWFNGAQHLREANGNVPLSASQGDDLTKVIVANRWKWNEQTGAKAICSDWPAPIGLSAAPLVRATIVGPTRKSLAALAKVWPVKVDTTLLRTDVVPMGNERPPNVSQLAASEYERDTTVPNGASIALVLELDDRRVLISADSHAETLIDAIDSRFDGKLTVDVATLPHHGSKRNMSLDLASRIVTTTWTVSTEGHEKHHFPNGESIARVLTRRKVGATLKLVFNSKHPEAATWNHAPTKGAYSYTTQYPTGGEDWVTIDL